jgi:hypothetical protein
MAGAFSGSPAAARAHFVDDLIHVAPLRAQAHIPKRGEHAAALIRQLLQVAVAPKIGKDTGIWRGAYGRDRVVAQCAVKVGGELGGVPNAFAHENAAGVEVGEAFGEPIAGRFIHFGQTADAARNPGVQAFVSQHAGQCFGLDIGRGKERKRIAESRAAHREPA